MRIAVGQLTQETNTFNPLPTTREGYEQFGVYRGAELLERMAETSEVGGFIQSLKRWPEQPDIVGLTRMMAWPSGLVTAETLAWQLDEMLGALRAALPVDGVLLSLHGALAAENEPDVSGAMLAAVRAEIGPRVPLVATLDLHANITARMVLEANALVLFHTAPHVDVFDTGERGAVLLRRMLVDGARPVTVWQKVPMVVPAERANTQDPTSISLHYRQRLQAIETDPRFLAAGLAPVQPWLDVPELGTSVVVVTDGDESLARATCAELAAEVWGRRREYLPDLVPVEEAVRQAHGIVADSLRESDQLAERVAHTSSRLVVLSDSADATTSGALGDSNWVLRELMKYAWPHGALVTLVAPQLVEQAERLGVGSEFEATLGGLRDSRLSSPLTSRVHVERLFDAQFVLSGHLARNLPIDMGRSAVVRVGDVRIVATSRSGPHFAPQLFQAAGLDPFAASVLVAKSPCGFRAAYADRAEKIIVVQAPGCAPADFWRYPYQHIPRPLWPWDDINTWEPARQATLAP